MFDVGVGELERTARLINAAAIAAGGVAEHAYTCKRNRLGSIGVGRVDRTTSGGIAVFQCKLTQAQNRIRNFEDRTYRTTVVSTDHGRYARRRSSPHPLNGQRTGFYRRHQ